MNSHPSFATDSLTGISNAFHFTFVRYHNFVGPFNLLALFDNYPSPLNEPALWSSYCSQKCEFTLSSICCNLVEVVDSRDVNNLSFLLVRALFATVRCLNRDFQI